MLISFHFGFLYYSTIFVVVYLERLPVKSSSLQHYPQKYRESKRIPIHEINLHLFSGHTEDVNTLNTDGFNRMALVLTNYQLS